MKHISKVKGLLSAILIICFLILDTSFSNLVVLLILSFFGLLFCVLELVISRKKIN